MKCALPASLGEAASRQRLSCPKGRCLPEKEPAGRQGMKAGRVYLTSIPLQPLPLPPVPAAPASVCLSLHRARISLSLSSTPLPHPPSLSRLAPPLLHASSPSSLLSSSRLRRGQSGRETRAATLTQPHQLTLDAVVTLGMVVRGRWCMPECPCVFPDPLPRRPDPGMCHCV